MSSLIGGTGISCMKQAVMRPPLRYSGVLSASGGVLRNHIPLPFPRCMNYLVRS